MASASSLMFFMMAAVLPMGMLAAIKADEINELPGWSGPLPSKQYSGYLSVIMPVH